VAISAALPLETASPANRSRL